MLVRMKYGGYALLVKHGGGEERVPLGFEHTITGLLACDSLTSDQRYLTLYLLYNTYRETKRITKNTEGSFYRVAFLEGRLKRKKQNHRYFVTVLPKKREAAT